MSQQKHTAEFERCIEQVMKQGHDKESAFAICTDSFKKAGKPIFVGEAETQKLHLFCESFKLEGNRVSGVAIHPRRIFHPEEGMTHVYLREELEKAASTLVGKPFGIDHAHVLPPPNIVTNSWYCPEHEGVCFEGIVDDHIAEQIRRKKFKGISIELNWLRPGGSVEYVNGVAPRNFEFTGVHLLKRFPPGDPDAYVKLWEQIKEQLVVAPALSLDQRVEALEQQFQELQNQINVIVGKLEVLTGSIQPTMDERVKNTGESLEKISSSNEEGEETSDEYEQFVARCLQSGKTMEECVAEWKRKQAKGESETRIVPEESIVSLRRRLVEIEAKLANIEKQKKQEAANWKERYKQLSEAVKGAIPPARIWKSWTLGPQRYVQENLKILREGKSR